MTSKQPKISTIVNQFFKDVQNELEGRYQSWNLCHEYFKKIFKENLNSNKEQAALMLGFYLASWGMYRGSSFLLKYYTYTVHIKAVEILFEYKHFFTQQEIKYEELFNLYKKLKTHYEKLKKQVVNNTKVSVSQTLITKIIMGVFGIIPAYDRNVKKALAKLGKSQTFNKTGYYQLLDFYRQYEKEINNLSSKEYPPMKILDIYLWKWGKDL